MGILSGMLLAAGIAFFSKKKLTKKNALENNTTPPYPADKHNQASDKQQPCKTSIINRIRTWIAKILRKHE